MRVYQWYTLCDNSLGRREVTLQCYGRSLVGSAGAPELWGKAWGMVQHHRIQRWSEHNVL